MFRWVTNGCLDEWLELPDERLDEWLESPDEWLVNDQMSARFTTKDFNESYFSFILPFHSINNHILTYQL